MIPLAEKLRPKTFDELIIQNNLKEKILAFTKNERLPCILLFGPPGSGKSTLAMLIANSAGKKFLRISAPEAGIPQLRSMLDKTDTLILDEIHRFSKAQQDFFLPVLENGTLTLIATTTENPSFSVTRQLLSRLHTLRLFALERDSLKKIAEKGLAYLGATLNNDILNLLISRSGGDARTLLNLVEYVTSLPENLGTNEKIKEILPEALQRHDKNGDSHYEIASALIKSIRGSDPDASIYYLACLLEGGEDPRFICRRLVLSASEDVGLADPNALGIAVACQQAVEFTGMPEGFIPLAETVIYLALAPKSNSAYAAYLAAAREIKYNGAYAVPLHLRNAATAMQKAWGYGENYKYPHNYPGSWVEQSYLPNELAEKKFYKSKNNGREPQLNTTWHKIRKNRK